jgi:hypothetical protein
VSMLVGKGFDHCLFVTCHVTFVKGKGRIQETG